MKPIALTVQICLFFQLAIFPQQIITSAGDNPKTDIAYVQWTLGQIVTGSSTDGNTTLIHGFQQSTLIFTTIYEMVDLDCIINAYPNPVTTQLSIDVEDPEKLKLTAILYNINGKLLLKKELISENITIDMSGFNTGTYLLHIRHQNNNIKKYKIVKQ